MLRVYLNRLVSQAHLFGKIALYTLVVLCVSLTLAAPTSRAAQASPSRQHSPQQPLAGGPTETSIPSTTSGATQTPTATATITPTSIVARGDWPMYGHDAQRTNYNPDEALIGAANIGDLAQAWRTNIGINETGFPAFSAPSVANGVVYIASSVGNGDNFFALDSQTGNRIWSAYIGTNPEECFSVGVGSTPAISGTLVAIGGGDGAYYGLDTRSGTRLWRDTLDVGPSGFAWVSPLLANGRAYVGVASDCDNPSVRGEVRSLDITDGHHIASQYIVPKGVAGGGIWQSPLISPDGTKIIEATGEDFKGYHGKYTRSLIVLDPDTLDIIAHDQEGIPDQDQDWNTTPIIFHDKTGRTLVGAGHKATTFYAYNLDDVSAGPVWSWNPGLATGVPPVYDPTFGDGGTLFFFSQQNRLCAIDPANGSERWPSVYIGDVRGSIAAANGLIYINRAGALLIIDERDGIILRAILTSAGRGSSGPVISNGTVYWVSGPYLNAWRIAPPSCPAQFSDLPAENPFYPYVNCLTCRGIVNGYEDGTFRPNNYVTRGQIARIVSISAGFAGAPTQEYQDVPGYNSFYYYVENLSQRGILGGYPCGNVGEECGAAQLSYFRPNTEANRGQISKIVSNAAGYNDPPAGQTFEDVTPANPYYLWVERLASRGTMGGYPCGGPGEPCGAGNRPYFRPYSNATRAQAAKIVSNTFFPDCQARDKP